MPTWAIVLVVLAVIAFILWSEIRSTNAEMRDLDSDDPDVRDHALDHW